MAQEEKFIQVGVTALRDPATGEFLPAVPLYIRADDSARAAEAQLTEDVGKLLAERGLAPVIICESAGTQAEDAQTMQRMYCG